MLLVLVVFGIGIVRSRFTPERTRRALAGRREQPAASGGAVELSSPLLLLLGDLPLFIGFLGSRIPLGSPSPS